MAAANPSTHVAVDAAVAISAAPATTVGLEDEKKCLEAQAARDWQSVIECAKGLESAGAKDKAKEYQATALREQDNQRRAAGVVQALEGRNLKDAEALLAKIGDSSVYYKSLSDQLVRTEAPILESNVRKAQAYAANHDCVGLQQWRARAAATSSRIFKEVQAVRCTEKAVPTVDPVALKPTQGSATPADAGADRAEERVRYAQRRRFDVAGRDPVPRGLPQAGARAAGEGAAPASRTYAPSGSPCCTRVTPRTSRPRNDTSPRCHYSSKRRSSRSVSSKASSFVSD